MGTFLTIKLKFQFSVFQSNCDAPTEKKLQLGFFGFTFRRMAVPPTPAHTHPTPGKTSKKEAKKAKRRQRRFLCRRRRRQRAGLCARRVGPMGSRASSCRVVRPRRLNYHYDVLINK